MKKMTEDWWTEQQVKDELKNIVDGEEHIARLTEAIDMKTDDFVSGREAYKLCNRVWWAYHEVARLSKENRSQAEKIRFIDESLKESLMLNCQQVKALDDQMNLVQDLQSTLTARASALEDIKKAVDNETDFIATNACPPVVAHDRSKEALLYWKQRRVMADRILLVSRTAIASLGGHQ